MEADVLGPNAGEIELDEPAAGRAVDIDGRPPGHVLDVFRRREKQRLRQSFQVGDNLGFRDWHFRLRLSETREAASGNAKDNSYQETALLRLSGSRRGPYPEGAMPADDPVPDRSQERRQLAACLVGVGLLALYLCWLMLQPFLDVLLWAIVLVIVFRPLNRILLARVGRR